MKKLDRKGCGIFKLDYVDYLEEQNKKLQVAINTVLQNLEVAGKEATFDKWQNIWLQEDVYDILSNALEKGGELK